MKALYTVAVAVIAALTFAAFNPESVGRMTRKAKVKFIDQPREMAEFRALLNKAETNDPDAQYRVGMTLASDGSARPEAMKHVLAYFKPEDGERMIRDAAAQGHPDARYWVWHTDGGSEEEFLEIHKTGSIKARLRVLKNFLNDICDRSWDHHVGIIQEHNHNPESYIYAHADFDDERVQEIATAFDERVALIHEARLSSCTQ